MKKQLIISFFFLFFAVFANAQMHKETREKIKSLKIAFITEQLNLSTKEAEQFWPIYNDYDERQHVLRSKQRVTFRKMVDKNGKIDSITEQQAKELIALKLDSDKQLLEVQKDFTRKISQVITYKKMVQLQIAEIEFGRNLMRKYRKMRSDSKDK